MAHLGVKIMSWSVVKLSEKCSCIFLDLHTCSMWHYTFSVWSGCKAGNHTEQVLATTSCKIVEALCIKIVFPNSVHHQGRTLASARDFLLSSFRSCPCKLEYMYFMELLPLSIDKLKQNFLVLVVTVFQAFCQWQPHDLHTKDRKNCIKAELTWAKLAYNKKLLLPTGKIIFKGINRRQKIIYHQPQIWWEKASFLLLPVILFSYI